MRYLSAALVVVTLLVCDLVAHSGYVSADQASEWSIASSFGFYLFIALIAIGRDER